MKERNLIAIISDEETITGIGLTGLENPKTHPVHHTVTEETTEEDLFRLYKEMMARNDVAIVFVGDFVMKKISKFIKKEDKQLLPTVMEIPSKLGMGL